MIVNVGIQEGQKIRIAQLLEYGESLNKFVQDAVEEKLMNVEAEEYDVVHAKSEGGKK